MPTYRITTPGGQTLKLTGDAPPSKEDIENIVMQMGLDKSVAGAETGAKARAEAPPEDSIAGMRAGPLSRDAQIADMMHQQEQGKAANIAIGSAAALAPMLAPARVAGAAYGGYEGYKHGGLPMAAAGAVSGAIAPGMTAAGLATASGYEHGGIPGAVIGGTLGVMAPRLASKFTSAAKVAKTATSVQTPAIEQATSQLAKALVENGMKDADARRIASAQIAQIMAETAPVATKAAMPLAAAGQEQLKVVNMAQALLREHSGNKAKVKALLQEMYPQSWEEMMNIITAKNTTMPSINMPVAK